MKEFVYYSEIKNELVTANFKADRVLWKEYNLRGICDLEDWCEYIGEL